MKIRSYYCVRAYNSLLFYRRVQDTLSVIVAFDLGYSASYMKCLNILFNMFVLNKREQLMISNKLFKDLRWDYLYPFYDSPRKFTKDDELTKST